MNRSRHNLVLFALISALVLMVACPASKPGGEETKKTDTKTDPVKKEGDKAPTPKKETGPVASVNGKDIPRADFDEMYDKMTRVYTKRSQPVPDNVARRHKKNILKRLIEKALLNGEIGKQAIKLTDAELEEGLAKYKEMFRTEANFQRYLKNSNTTLDKIKANIRYNKTLDKLLEKGSAIEVTEVQAKEYYTQNKRRYQEREQVKSSHILLKLNKDSTPAQVDEAKKKATDITKQAKKKGADFGALAKKYSQGPTAPKGGNLGYFSRGRMAKAFEEVSFKLKPGKVSDPVRTKFGWHIIKTFDHRPSGEKPFAEVKDSILKLLESRERRLRKSKILRDLKATAKIEKHLSIPAPTRKTPPGASGSIAPSITTSIAKAGSTAAIAKTLAEAKTAAGVGVLPTPPPKAAPAATAGK
jgi:peptidyl-prolyl cis-trans isomerase C